MTEISNDFIVGTTIAGVVIAALSIGLVIGFLFGRSTQRQSNSVGGFSIARDERGRVSDIISLPTSSFGGILD